MQGILVVDFAAQQYLDNPVPGPQLTHHTLCVLLMTLLVKCLWFTIPSVHQIYVRAPLSLQPSDTAIWFVTSRDRTIHQVWMCSLAAWQLVAPWQHFRRQTFTSFRDELMCSRTKVPDRCVSQSIRVTALLSYETSKSVQHKNMLV